VASRFRRSVPVVLAALVASACGILGGDGSPESEGGPESAPGPDTVAVAADSSGDTSGTTTGVEGGGLDEPGDEPAPVVAVQPTDTRAFLLSRLDSVLSGQRGLERRLDSLAADAGTVDTAAAADTEPAAVLGEAGRSVQSFTVAAFLSVIVIILFNVLIRGSVWLLDALAERQPRRRLLYKRLVPIIRIVLWIFAAYLIVRVIFRVDAQGLVAAAAAIGVAVGFAAQDLLKNLFGGLILVFDQPFQVGDKIRVGETYGEVKSIGLRSTRIVTPDDNLVSVPNAQVVDQQVANANAGELNCQVVTDLYLPGWADEETAKRIAFDAATSSKYVFLNKPIVVLVSDVFKETFLTRVRVKAYVLDPRFEFLFQSDITERARAGFREAGLLRPSHMRPYLVEQALTREATSDPAEST
jgi:small-conductance mechanosensitive channel